VDSNGMMYAGNPLTVTPKFEFSTTDIPELSSQNLCNVKTSAFGSRYTDSSTNLCRVKTSSFGSNYADSSTDPVTKAAERALITKKAAQYINKMLSIPVYARGLLADAFNLVPRHVSSLVGLAALPFVFVPIALDYASGRSAIDAMTANTVGFTAGYAMNTGINNITSRLTAIAARSSVRFAARSAILGARTGRFAGALVGLFVGIALYDYTSGKVYDILENVPDSTDHAYFGYDDYFVPSP
jgi:tetrahydromethanopterin S-methyltransferase subunit G